ncbi:hypothetical protein [Mycolicibacterium conceptionense]|uniref:hypothetical protein n=1 Tax=Mycolicibacterium conceptionense TaxID=451644 RepID=UPI00096C75FF|nr:hypothetical protein [Mycolicibacterium conceptionense]OMB79237.1 hypothetical protein A5743_14120 [Mycolicibacterium conceptionense]
MTLTPAQHYQRADELLAELETYDPIAATRVPTTQFKLRLAEVHARLAQSPWWPDLVADRDDDPTAHQCEPWQHLEHPDGGCYCGACGARPPRPYLDWDTGKPKPCPIETRCATGDRL